MGHVVQLIGAEEVQQAGRAIAHAAAEISNAASRMEQAVYSVSQALERHQTWADDWLERFKASIQDLAERKKTATLIVPEGE